MLCPWDIETAAHPDAEQFADPIAIEPVEPNRSIKDPEKQAAWMAEKEAKLLADAMKRKDKYGLDPYLGRIVSLAYSICEGVVQSFLCKDEDAEARAIEAVFEVWADGLLVPCGYCSRTFDHPFINTRARLLGVHIPKRYRDVSRWSDNVVDLFDVTNFGERLNGGNERAMSRGLVSMCRRYRLGIPDDDSKGDGIAALVAANTPESWAQIERHNALDVLRTQALAKRLGVA